MRRVFVGLFLALLAGSLLVLPSASATSRPSQPTSVVLRHGNGSITVSWKRSASTGGAPTAYQVFRAPHGYGPWTRVSTTIHSGVRITSLSNGHRYFVRIRAVNRNGFSGFTKPISEVPSTRPGDVTRLQASPKGQNARSTVTWAPPSTNGGAPINAYVVFQRDASKPMPTWSLVGIWPATARSATVTGLTNGDYYDISVTARNRDGYNPPRTNYAWDQPTAAPAVPVVSTFQSADGGADVHVNFNYQAGVASPLSAQVEVWDQTVSPSVPAWVIQDCQCVSSRVADIRGLVAGHTYAVEANATNSGGTSGWSTPIAITASAPGLTSCAGIGDWDGSAITTGDAKFWFTLAHYDGTIQGIQLQVLSGGAVVGTHTFSAAELASGSTGIVVAGVTGTTSNKGAIVVMQALNGTGTPSALSCSATL